MDTKLLPGVDCFVLCNISSGAPDTGLDPARPDVGAGKVVEGLVIAPILVVEGSSFWENHREAPTRQSCLSHPESAEGSPKESRKTFGELFAT